MKDRRFPFYPLIAAAFPVVSVYSSNLAYVPVEQLWRPLFVTVGATAILWAALSLVLRSVHRGAAAAMVLVLCFFANGFVEVDLLPSSPYSTYVWGAVTLLLTGLAAWKLTATKVLNVLALAVAAVALVNIGYRLGKASYLASRPAPGKVTATRQGPKPDVFYIVLDGHGRTDSVKRAIGYDDSWFVQALRKRGFYVADESHSNYAQTELSLASSLNLDFIPNLLPKIKPSDISREPLGSVLDHNEAARRFRAEGYRFVSVTTGFPPVRLAGADLHLGDGSGRTMVETALLSMTPLRHDTGIVRSQYDTRRKQLLSAFDDLRALAAPTEAPRFVVAHILAPHPPFVFGPKGESVRIGGLYSFMDGSDFLTNVGTAEQYRRGYAGQAEFIEKKVLEAVDAIVAGKQSGPRPIIVIQGDHGSKIGLDQNSLARTDLNEVFPILNAYLVPDEVRKALRPKITPVNSFRTILRELFGEDLPSLRDRSWYSTFPLPYDLTDVTDRLRP
ncbi:hypothetical protein EON82_12130 [bacterium]|nr:MAG: hypothetical protein EON82_12130 [bacterium]